MHKKDYHMAPARDMREKSEEGVWDTVKVIIQALLIAFFVRTFFYQPFNIPSEFMYPTLKVGDYLLLSKLSYGYSKYSFNFSFGGFGTTWIKCCPIDFPGRVVLADTPKRETWQCSAADRYEHRLHQAGDRPAGRPHPDARWRSLHQWRSGEEGTH